MFVMVESEALVTVEAVTTITTTTTMKTDVCVLSLRHTKLSDVRIHG